MNKIFYPKMALINLKKNADTYVPYILTCIGSVIAFYTMISFYGNKGLDEMPGSYNLKTILFLGTIVIGVFSVIFLFYTNSFLIKRRKKELGLYSILGLEKKHIARVLFYETVVVTVTSLTLGLLGGILIGKLLYLLLLKLLHFTTPIQFYIDGRGLLITAGVFLAIFFLTLVTNFLQVKMANPINLLRGGEHGEKEPKSSWIITLIGVIALAIGYGIALTVKSPIEAIVLFFVAVIFVIIGTYALFTSGSIAFLKVLKKNKDFYYQSRNFISVSGMIYRMKQNAVGLANICILSTMVLVTISTTVSLYVGQESMMRDMYIFDNSIMGEITENDEARVDETIVNTANLYDVKLLNRNDIKLGNATAFQEGDTFRPDQVPENERSADYYTSETDIWLIPLADYNKMCETAVTLNENEVLIFSIGDNYNEKTMNIGDRSFSVKEELQTFPLEKKKTEVIEKTAFIIVENEEIISEIQNTLNPEKLDNHLSFGKFFNLEGNDEAKQTFSNNLFQQVEGINPDISQGNYYVSLASWYSIFGGFLFLGIFLGTMFMMATVLIIYFKQISEGYEDRARFEIMQKVGMDKREVRKTIGKQILMVFFLPLAGAAVHVAFAFRVMAKMLAAFRLTDTGLILICTVAVTVIYALIYALVYWWTAKAYFKLVR
ncbi:FtsX-like permease family protein [Acetobacterium fimetarium]|uniref:FtsX-like permease family protein n=1 Tax=Acetobacterium fimetarium TaxID=52691 RepID=A0ABR6WSN0_9FIRM|nr:FtsX-like permease family protein [Acetobacterium fimetarium]MBC3803629.1 FtsX-like permease family protein [Acetobacterium fimetarium]